MVFQAGAEQLNRQLFSIGAYEQPPAALVRTDRQILLVRESRRIVRRQVTYGSDAWLMPLARLHTASIVSDQRGPEVQLTLEHMGVTDVVRLPVPPELAERALASSRRTFQRGDKGRVLCLSYSTVRTVGQKIFSMPPPVTDVGQRLLKPSRSSTTRN